ncbi:1-acyl-sn-glycerol-3-phosphate acyltransferase [Crocosphaera sp.]|uniref:lysophospholipid acyltransferase family protein n=1 Tax=Crocosphaera sp. TaxID=2729996 RepID=UPI00262887F2|nr:1-acyl-sn-glycerol-3-phosphate acyltransferase [Crocosphaera sp.]MDJ0581817.1 1-acyl-sn-glycerol-3-phosphate acyltransferase [Crocosphaera sp.]
MSVSLESPHTKLTITPHTIQRAKEGLSDAQNPQIKKAIQQGLNDLETIAEGTFQRPIDGNFRHFILRSLIHSLFRVKVDYPELIPRSPVILVANHLNHIDPFLLLSESSASPYFHILGDARTLYNKWWKRFILGLSGGVIPLERRWGQETAIIEAAEGEHPELKPLAQAIAENVPSGESIKTLRQINKAVEVILAQKQGLMLFPEGRLGATEGKLSLPLKRGTAIYALRSGVPVVPVGLVGTKNLYYRKTLTVRFGEPLSFPQVKHPKRQDIDNVLESLENALVELLPSHYQEPDELKLFSGFLNHFFC